MRAWVAGLKREGLRPVLEVVARVKRKYALRAEAALIHKYRRRGKLLNAEIPSWPPKYDPRGMAKAWKFWSNITEEELDELWGQP